MKPAKLQFDDDTNEVVECTCLNVSIGGMHVSVDEQRPQGSLVRFELFIEEDLNIRGLGEVIWARAGSPGTEAGMGIKFRFLEQRDRQMIFKLVSEHIKNRLSQKHPSIEEDESSTRIPAPDPAILAALKNDRPLPAPEALAPAAVPAATPAPTPRSDFASLGPTEAPDTAVLPPEPPGAGDWQNPPAAPPSPPAASPIPSAAPPIFDETLPDLPFEGAAPNTGGDAPGPDAAIWGDADFDPPLDTGDTSEGGDDSALFEGGYDPDELYRPRAARRRDFPVIPMVALLVIVGGVLVYLNWEKIFGPSAPPVSTTAELDPGTDPAATPGTEPADTAAPPETAPVETPAPPPAAPPPSATAPPPVKAPPSPPPPPAAAGRDFRQVLDISWTRGLGGGKVEIKTDGMVPQSRYSNFRLEGENPREVIRLTKVRQRYERSELRIEGSPVRRIRIGYHANQELHVVLDMADSSSRVSRIRNRGTTLEIFVE